MIEKLNFRVIERETPAEDAAFEIQEQHRRFFFVPEPVFRHAVRTGQLIGAFQNDKLVAYIWSNLKDRTVRVLYLCVHRDHSRQGIGRQLIDELKRRHATAFRIRLSCRTDYPGWKFWKAIGFRVLRNRPGRAKGGSEVTDFVFEMSPLPLFGDLEVINPRPKVAIDSNVFFDLCNEHRPHYLESSGLLADWIEADFELCITAALSEDTSQTADSAVTHLDMPIIKAPHRAFQCILQQLNSLIGMGTTHQDIVDRHHLAHAIAENVHAFVTRDSELLESADKIYDQFGTMVLRPVEFIVDIDNASNQLRFDRKDLLSIRLSVVRTDHSNNLDSKLSTMCRQGEKVSTLKARLRGWQAHPDRFDVLSILDSDNELQAICAVEKTESNVNVRLLRSSLQLKGKRKGRTIIRCLLSQIRTRYSGPVLIEVSDPVGASEAGDALTELGFVFHETSAYKVSLPGVWALSEAYEAAKALIIQNKGPTSLISYVAPNGDDLDPPKYLQFEHRLWPVKVNSGGCVPCLVVPIRPHWARALFDPQLGQRQFWDEDADLLLNPVNAYYTAARPNQTCGRILWYVSQSDSFSGSMRVRACSQMTKRVIAPPIQLYRQFRHFGVYKLDDIEKLCNSRHSDVVAIEVRDSELFSTPVQLYDIRNVLDAPDETFQWPTKIDESEFFEIYQRGIL
jgi:ribosomal protein S18 acetylase RimI-like enzyme